MEGFGALMNMFAPQPGMDPFALGNTLATNPEAALPALAGAGPPPAQGQGFMDWVSQKLSGPGNPPPSDTGMPMLPPPAMPPRTPMPGGTPSAAGVGGDISSAFNAAFPGAGARMGRETPSGMDLAGDQPSPFAPGAPGTQPPPVPSGLAAAVAPPPVQGARPDIQTDMGPGGSQTPAAASPKPPTATNATADALKKAGSAFSGIKAPPAPTTQHISTPNLPRPQAMQTGGIEALIQAMLGRQAAGGVNPLRLGNALYAGGRGIY